jgi:hypothetical protein
VPGGTNGEQVGNQMTYDEAMRAQEQENPVWGVDGRRYRIHAIRTWLDENGVEHIDASVTEFPTNFYVVPIECLRLFTWQKEKHRRPHGRRCFRLLH